MSSTHRERLHSSRRTFIARENIAAREEHTTNLRREARENESEPVKFIRKIIYRSGILRDVQPRREMEKERNGEKETRVAYFWRERTLPHSRGLKNVLLLIYTPFQKLRMHKHRLAQAGLFSHLPPRLYKDTFCHDPKIQNQRGILLTIYVGISSTLYPGTRQERALATRDI